MTKTQKLCTACKSLCLLLCYYVIDVNMLLCNYVRLPQFTFMAQKYFINICTESAQNEYRYPTILYSWLLYSTMRVLILLHLQFSFKLLKKLEKS